MPRAEVLIALLVVVAGLARIAGLTAIPCPCCSSARDVPVAAISGLPAIELDLEDERFGERDRSSLR